MENDPTAKHIEALHRELDDYQQDHDDTAWILMASKGDGAVCSIGGRTRYILMLLVQVIANLTEGEDDPEDFAERVIGVLSDTMPKALELYHKRHAANDSIEDALKNLARALKNELED